MYGGSAISEGSHCTDPACGKFLVLYSLKKLSANDNNLFEAHLLECEQCFDDLSALDRTAGILHQYLDEPPEGLPFAPQVLKKGNRLRPLAVAASILLVAFGAWLLRGQFSSPDGEPLQAASHQATAFSADLDDVSPELRAIFFTARRWVMGDRPEEGRDLLSVAEDRRGPGGTEFYEVLRERAILEMQMGAPIEAMNILLNAIDEAMKSDHVQKYQQIALTRVLLAQLNFIQRLNQQEGDEALAQAEADAEAAESLETSYLILEAQCHHALLVKGKYTAALELANQALALLPEPTPRALLLVARANEALAVASGVDGKPLIAQALQLVDRAYILAEADKDEDDRANALALEGRLNLLTGDLNQAYRNLSTAVEIYGDYCLSFQSLNARINLAHVYLRQNRVKDAERILTPIRRAEERMNNPYLTFDYHRMAAWIELKGGDERAAEKHFKEAEAIGRRLFSTWIRQTEMRDVRMFLNSPKAEPKLPKAFSTGIY
ncbi:MAG: tetratricopeptide repeat protein [Planctomycetota bacterium]